MARCSALSHPGPAGATGGPKKGGWVISARNPWVSWAQALGVRAVVNLCEEYAGPQVRKAMRNGVFLACFAHAIDAKIIFLHVFPCQFGEPHVSDVQGNN